MRNLAEFKRNLHVGRKLHTIFHKKNKGRDEAGNTVFGDEDRGVRVISIVQTNSFAIKTTEPDGKIVDSWCQYPKSSECIFNSDGSVTIQERDRDNKLSPVLTYKFID